MTTTITRQKARPKTDAVDMIWYDGTNAVEVAQFLQEHGLRPSVEFHGFGHTLSLNGHRIDPEKDDNGLWILQDGRRISKRILATNWEVVERR